MYILVICTYFFLCIITFLISFYFFLFLFIAVYFFLFLFISLFWRKKRNMILNVFFSDHPNHVVTNLLQPAPPFSLAETLSRNLDENSLYTFSSFLGYNWNIKNVGAYKVF